MGRSAARWRSPFGLICGIALGLINGVGVAYLRIPSMIITLAVNAVARGLMVAYTGGFSPQDSASTTMRFLAPAISRSAGAASVFRTAWWFG